MSDGSISQAKIDDLLSKIRGTDLDEDQRKLLEAMIKMAREVEEVTISTRRPTFSESFDDSFTPGAAEVVLSYANDESDSDSPASKHSQIAQYITR